LTTVTDHRPAPLGKGTDVRTAGDGSDHLIDGIARRAGALSVRRPPSPSRLAKKVLDDSRPKTEKTCPDTGRNRYRKPNAGSRGSCEASRHGGIPARQASKTFCWTSIHLSKNAWFLRPRRTRASQPSDETAGGLVRVRLGAL